jgi:beta-glucanase (GH16 family)
MTLALGALLLAAAPQWKMTFHDEFDGQANAAPSTERWTRDLGGGGFGNNELESYTEGNKNAFLDGHGNLIIEARKEPTRGKDGISRDFSSARLKSTGLFSQAYGKFEARVKIPHGKGIWPAIWMLGDNIGTVGWPTCGEIDILESIGEKADIAYGTLHGPGYSGGAGKQGKFLSKESLAAKFHVYGIEWEPEVIRWYVDGKLYHTVTRKDIGSNKWVFDKPQFLIMNLAVGGGWPGSPDETTVFPQRLVID